MVRYSCYDCSFGMLVIGYVQDTVVSIRVMTESVPANVPSPATDLAARQLQEYFSGIRKEFDFPIRPRGTAFQLAVWDALMQIPYGQTRSYGDIATAIGKPKAARAVGLACNRNPIWIVIPCHRVVGKDRNLTGYAGGLDMKRALLQTEQSNP